MPISAKEFLESLPRGHPARRMLSAGVKSTRSRRKYRNQPTIVNGMRFDSKREAEHYQTICQMQQAGQVLWFTRQVPFWLPGNIVYRCDFLVVMSDGSIRIIDSKGVRTREYRMKRRLLESSYPLTIEEW